MLRNILPFTLATIFILIMIGGCLPSNSQLPSRQFESEPVSLETFPLSKLEFYDKTSGNRLYVADNSESVQWNSILENNCKTHYPNHPGYDKTISAKGIYENGELNYELHINTKARNIDLYRVRIEKDGDWTNVFVLGVYRCEGLVELFEQFLLMDP